MRTQTHAEGWPSGDTWRRRCLQAKERGLGWNQPASTLLSGSRIMRADACCSSHLCRCALLWKPQQLKHGRAVKNQPLFIRTESLKEDSEPTDVGLKEDPEPTDVMRKWHHLLERVPSAW